MIDAVPLFSSSSGNSFYIKCNDEEILIDAGVSCKMLNAKLCALGTSLCNISRIFITHEHTDHIKAIETISKSFNIPIIINSASAHTLQKEKFPNANKNFIIADPGNEVFTDNFKFSIFRTPHDSAGSVGFRIESCDGDTLGYATDIGIITRGIARNLCGCKTVVIESNHDINMLKNGPYPYFTKQRILSDYGHLSNKACAEFLPVLVKSGTKNIFLAHLSYNNNTPKTAYDCAMDALQKNGITQHDVKLCVAAGE